MYQIRKKGATGIIYTIIIVLVATLAVSLVWSETRSLVEDPLFSPEFSCFDLEINQPLHIEETCYNETSQDLEIVLHRNSPSPSLEDIEFSLSISNSTVNYKCCPTCATCLILDEGQLKKYYLNYNGTNTPEEVSLYTSSCFLEQKQVNSC